MTSQSDKDKQDRFRTVQRAAIGGDPNAQFQLAELYKTGAGCAQDLAASCRWYLVSSEQEYAPSEFQLALSYLLGIGTARSSKDAGRYLLRASNRGYGPAQFVLGLLLARGLVFKQHLNRGRHWLQRASAAGHKLASAELKRISVEFPSQTSPATSEPRRQPPKQALPSDSIPKDEWQKVFSDGVRAGRELAEHGFLRYRKRILARAHAVGGGALDFLDPAGELDDVYQLALDSARQRGYLDLGVDDGLDGICDGSDVLAPAYKEALIEGIEAGIRAAVYGDEEQELGEHASV